MARNVLYDIRGKIKKPKKYKINDPDKGVTKYKVDKLGRVISPGAKTFKVGTDEEVVPRTARSQGKVSNFLVDKMGRVISPGAKQFKINPDGSTGNETTLPVQRSQGQVNSYKIDKFGRVISPGAKQFKINPDGSTGNETTLPVQRSQGQVNSYKIDKFGRVISPGVKTFKINDPEATENGITTPGIQTPNITEGTPTNILNAVKAVESPTGTDNSMLAIDRSRSPETPVIPPVDKDSAYWGQMVGKTGIPLDRFVQLAGMLSGAIDPTGAAGRLGKDLSAMGGKAYEDRISRERNAPNALLQKRLAEAKVADAEGTSPNAILNKRLLEAKIEDAESVTDKWELYNKAKTSEGVPIEKQIRDFRDLTGTPVKKQFTPSTEHERLYSEYKKDYIAAEGEGVAKNSAGKMMSAYEFKKFMEPVSQILMTPTGPVLVNKSGEFTRPDGEEVSPAELGELTGLPKSPDPIQQLLLEKIRKKKGIKQGEEVSLSDVWRDREAPANTESSLRKQLVDAKVNDPSIDVERAMKYYKSIGKY